MQNKKELIPIIIIILITIFGIIFGPGNNLNINFIVILFIISFILGIIYLKFFTSYGKKIKFSQNYNLDGYTINTSTRNNESTKNNERKKEIKQNTLKKSLIITIIWLIISILLYGTKQGQEIVIVISFIPLFGLIVLVPGFYTLIYLFKSIKLYINKLKQTHEKNDKKNPFT